MALNSYADCVDVILPDRLVLIDFCAYKLTSKKYCTTRAVVQLNCSASANTVKDASFSCGIPASCNVAAQQKYAGQFSTAIKIISSITPYASNEAVSINTAIGLYSNVNAAAMRRRTLSDLDGVMLSEIGDMTLQELYWIEK